MTEADTKIKTLLTAVYEDCFNEDQSIRESQIRQWRRLKLLWEGFANVWYSEVAHDWRVWTQEQDSDDDQAYYDKPINVFKAYLESIIAALSVTVPPIKCYPDDADNTLDLATAKAGDKIAQLLYKHNNVPMLWLHALFTYQTEGMVAFRNQTVESVKFGTYDTKEYQDETSEQDVTKCSKCGYVLSQSPVPVSPAPQGSGPVDTQGQTPQIPGAGQPEQNIDDDDIGDKFDPDDDDAPLDYELNENGDICPACMQMMNPEISREHFVTTRFVGVTKSPKSRIVMGAYGGLYVKVGVYAKDQESTPYLIYSHEEDYALTCERFSHIHGNEQLKSQMQGGNGPGGYTQYEQWGRLSPQYLNSYPTNVVTVSEAFIRPGKFNILSEEDAKFLKKKFPDGVAVTFVNDVFAEACNKNLDDEWTLLQNPLSDYLYFTPPGQGLVSIQEITNDLISLMLQTIEHGIGQTFADPGVLNFNGYEQMQVLPGGVYPAIPKSGKSLGDGFYQLKTANLSPEVMPFAANIQSLAQLESGALPSLFGGDQTGGSQTASQYSMSRAQALQRLQNTWKMFTTAWKEHFGKSVPAYIKTVQEDERNVERDNDGNFVNTFIRMAELEGKIGKVELEANENLPMTWSQRKDLLMNLMTATNPEIIKILNAPENAAVIHEALGLVDFYMPGEDDIIKQYNEIKVLLNSEPIPTGNPQDPEMSSVQIDPMYDNNQLEFEIVRKWAISEAGQQAKVDNPDGYRNVLLHGKLHFQQVQMVQQAQMASQLPPDKSGKVPNSKPNQTRQEAPIVGDR